MAGNVQVRGGKGLDLSSQISFTLSFLLLLATSLLSPLQVCIFLLFLLFCPFQVKSHLFFLVLFPRLRALLFCFALLLELAGDNSVLVLA